MLSVLLSQAGRRSSCRSPARNCNPPAGVVPQLPAATRAPTSPALLLPRLRPLQKRGCITHHRMWTAPDLGVADIRVHAPAAGLHMGAEVPLPALAATHFARSPLPVSLCPESRIV